MSHEWTRMNTKRPDFVGFFVCLVERLLCLCGVGGGCLQKSAVLLEEIHHFGKKVSIYWKKFIICPIYSGFVRGLPSFWAGIAVGALHETAGMSWGFCGQIHGRSAGFAIGVIPEQYINTQK